MGFFPEVYSGTLMVFHGGRAPYLNLSLKRPLSLQDSDEVVIFLCLAGKYSFTEIFIKINHNSVGYARYSLTSCTEHMSYAGFHKILCYCEYVLKAD